MKLKFKKCIFYTLFLAIPTIFISQTENHIPDISENNLHKHIKALASDEFLGRQPGTKGEKKTVTYLVNQLKKIGIAPANGDSYYQEFTIARLKYNKPSKMVIWSPKGKTEYIPDKDFFAKTMQTISKEIKIENADMVFAGFGIIAPEYNWDDYKDIDVKDKIVIVLFSDPGFYTKNDTLFNGMQPTHHAYRNRKAKLAFDRGAKGMLMVHHEVINWEGALRAPNAGYSQPFLKGFEESISDGLDLTGMISIPMMRSLIKNSGQDYDYLEKALSKKNKDISLKTKISITNSTGLEDYVKTKNVLGILKGKKRPDEHIIYTSHWDHIGTRPSYLGKDSIFNGAIDNASGTAINIEIARTYKNLKKKPERSILFFFTSAEEMGLLGAEFYAENPIYPLNKAVCVINSDGNFAVNKMKTATNVLKGYSELDKYVDEAVSKVGRKVVPDDSPAYMNIFKRSDHYPFVKKGVPSVWAMGNQDPETGGLEEAKKVGEYMQHYHQVTDEYYEGFNVKNMIADAQMNFLIGYILANLNVWPNWNNDVEYKAIRDKSLSLKK